MSSKFWLALAITVLCAQNAFAQQFAVGQRVTFQDPHSRYGGGTVSGTIVKDRGASWEYAGRYDVKIDAPGGPNDFFNATDLTLAGANGAAGAAPHAAAPPPAAEQANPQQAAVQPAAANPQHAPVPAGKAFGPNDWGSPPKRGSFKYGKPNLQTMLGHKAITPPGLKEYFVGTPPGDESAVGRWYTRTGGVFAPGPTDANGVKWSTWGNPEVAELIIVGANGTWSMNNHGKVTQGRWYDIGQNVIRLVNLADNCDWTASVYDHMIQFKGYNGITKEGNRY